MAYARISCKNPVCPTHGRPVKQLIYLGPWDKTPPPPSWNARQSELSGDLIHCRQCREYSAERVSDNYVGPIDIDLSETNRPIYDDEYVLFKLNNYLLPNPIQPQAQTRRLPPLITMGIIGTCIDCGQDVKSPYQPFRACTGGCGRAFLHQTCYNNSRRSLFGSEFTCMWCIASQASGAL